MRKRNIFGSGVMTGTLVLAGTALAMASAEQSEVPSRGIAVYVGDFELSVAPAPGSDPPNPGSGDKSAQQLQLRPCQVQNYFGETLVETLRKQGYSSSRSQVLSGNGILLKGVFAGPDKKNRIRRALLGSGSPGTKLTLYVGVFDAKSVSQLLYI